MTTETTTAAPAVFLHLCTVYEHMMRDTRQENVPGENGLVTVYEGHLTKLIQIELGLAVPYYTSVTQAMKGMGVAEQIKRGGGSSPSRWIIRKEPLLADYENWERTKGKRPSSNSKTAILEGRVNDLNTRVESLEETISTLLDALKD